MGKVFQKAVYRQYTDDTFSTQSPQQVAAMGMAGPLIHAEVGDQINVIFKVSIAAQPSCLQALKYLRISCAGWESCPLFF